MSKSRAKPSTLEYQLKAGALVQDNLPTQEEIEELQLVPDALADSNAQLEKELAEANAENAHLLKVIAARGDITDNLRDENDAQRVQLKELSIMRAALASITDERDAAREERERAIADLEDMADERDNRQKALEAASEELEHLRIRIDECHHCLMIISSK